MSDVVQGPKPAKKIHSKDEFELCYLRHQYLRKANLDLTEDQMKPYYGIIRYFAKRTFFTYFGLFQLVGFESEDLINIGKIHLVSYLGLYSLETDEVKHDKFIDTFLKINNSAPDTTDKLNKNKADFTSFLKQRMEDVVRVCHQKARNIKGMQTDDYLVFYGPNTPPEDLTDFQLTYSKYGFKKLDVSLFKSKKRKFKEALKTQSGPVYKLDGLNYVCVAVNHRNLELLDLVGADWNPYESIHNMTPEEVLFHLDDQKEFEIKKNRFLSMSREYRHKKLSDFISLHQNDPMYNEEVQAAKKMMKEL